MKHYLFILCLLSSTIVFAQGDIFPVEKCTAVIKGNVKNNTDKFWELGLTGYFNSTQISVPIDEKGNFSKTIGFDGNAQDLYLYLNNDAVTIDIRKNDTIETNWDAKDFNNSFTVKAANEKRNKELQVKLLIVKNFRKPFMDLYRSLYTDKLTDSVKFIRINNLYNQEIETVFTSKVITDKLFNDIYYKYTSMLSSHHLLPAYDLFIKDTVGKNHSWPLTALVVNKKWYKNESESTFKTSSEARDFIFNYVRFNKPLDGNVLIGSKDDAAKARPFSPAWSDYYQALASLGLYQQRDWFITKSIMMDFEYYSFDDATAVYKDFIPKIKVKAYADTLAVFYKNVLTLKPGNMAPDFTLINNEGKTVSLKDLRGKVVYIDFWGVGCGPCINDIKNAVPQFHEKYKDKNIEFVNICVDVKADTWKYNLASLKLGGINLLAEGWTNNPVCKKYNVNGIPHYYIIGADGKIVDNNSPRPSDGEQLYAKLDKLLNNKQQ